MVPSGRCVQLVKAKGSIVQWSQYWAEGRTFIFTLTPISFHMLTMAWTAIASQSGSFLQKISTSKPSGWPASASSFLASAMFCFMKGSL